MRHVHPGGRAMLVEPVAIQELIDVERKRSAASCHVHEHEHEHEHQLIGLGLVPVAPR